MTLIVFDLEWNIGYQPRMFDYHGVEQTLRGEIIQIGAAKVDEHANLLDTFSMTLKPRIFRKLQHHIAKVTGLTQADLDHGVPIREGLQKFVKWCGPDAAFGEWGMDDVPVLKQNLFLNGLDESWPTRWYDLQQVFLAERGRAEGEGMTLESVITRLGIPTDRPFHDALSDALYTVDVCQKLDFAKGLAAYPTEEQQLREAAQPAGSDCRDVRCFFGYLDKEIWREDPELHELICPECGAHLAPDTQPRDGGEVELWMKRGNNSYYSLTRCTGCGRQWFTRYKMARRDGLHWAFARCHEVPAPDAVAKWNKQKRLQLERLKKRDEKPAE